MCRYALAGRRPRRGATRVANAVTNPTMMDGQACGRPRNGCAQSAPAVVGLGNTSRHVVSGAPAVNRHHSSVATTKTRAAMAARISSHRSRMGPTSTGALKLLHGTGAEAPSARGLAGARDVAVQGLACAVVAEGGARVPGGSRRLQRGSCAFESRPRDPSAADGSVGCVHRGPQRRTRRSCGLKM